MNLENRAWGLKTLPHSGPAPVQVLHFFEDSNRTFSRKISAALSKRPPGLMVISGSTWKMPAGSLLNSV